VVRFVLWNGCVGSGDLTVDCTRLKLKSVPRKAAEAWHPVQPPIFSGVGNAPEPCNGKKTMFLNGVVPSGAKSVGAPDGAIWPL
jgi:hypothetical protein